MVIAPVDELAAYHRASQRLLGLIGGERSGGDSSVHRFQRAATRLAQTRSLLHAFDDPQLRYPIVHLTGTSGKGSVAAMIAAMLTAAGYRVGLRTSPYLQVATEKLQLDSLLIDARSLDRVSAQVVATHKRLMPGIRLRYAEAWSALTLVWFAEQQVDVAIVEVGAGGRFDATNVFEPAVSVITTVGLDHTSSLGPTIADIAWHKAGIIKRGTTAVVGAVPDAAWSVIQQEANTARVPILRAGSAPATEHDATAMPGAFQTANAAVALTTIDALRARGFLVPESACMAGLSSARLPGRLERMPGGESPAFWLDGAHNADKIAALAREATRFSTGGHLPVVVLGLLKAKDAAAIAAGIAPLASAIVATEPTVTGRAPLPASDLAAALEAAGYSQPLITDPAPFSALREAELLARSSGSSVIVTGSMYLVGQVRRRWYPDDDIVVQRTQWPSAIEAPAQALPERSVAL